MRWKTEPNPEVGDERIVKRYLWLPKTINHDTRWLEHACWREKYKSYLSERYLSENSWRAVEWLD